MIVREYYHSVGSSNLFPIILLREDSYLLQWSWSSFQERNFNGVLWYFKIDRVRKRISIKKKKKKHIQNAHSTQRCIQKCSKYNNHLIDENLIYRWIAFPPFSLTCMRFSFDSPISSNRLEDWKALGKSNEHLWAIMAEFILFDKNHIERNLRFKYLLSTDTTEVFNKIYAEK